MAGRRPRPLVADSLLAIVLALATLAVVDARGAVDEGPATRLDWTVTPAPRDIRPGDVWDARVTVFRNGRPATPPGGAVPLLTVLNTSTGEWTTRPTRPAGGRARLLSRPRGVPGCRAIHVLPPARGPARDLAGRRRRAGAA